MIGISNFIHTGKEGPELRQIKISPTHVSANHYHRHLEFFHHSFGLIRSGFGILQGERGSPEITGELPTARNHLSKAVVVLTGGLHTAQVGPVSWRGQAHTYRSCW
jgi:hypothetical protein